MKKFLVVAGMAAALLFGGMSASNAAGLTVCLNVDVNGQGTGGEQCVESPALPALP